MRIPSFLIRKLRNNSVAWCIGVPYTEEQFKECVSLNSDFIESLSDTYNVYDYDLLWEQYKTTANLIHETVNNLKSRNVKIVQLSSISEIKGVLDYENIIITAHHHRSQFAMEFMGSPIPIGDFIENIPLEYSGTIDISSCYSATFLQELKLQASNARIIAANTESSLYLRMFIYKHIVKYLTKNNDAEYLDAYKDITGKIVDFYKGQHNEQPQKIMLGGKPQSVSVFAPQRISKKESMMVQVYLYSDEECKKVKTDAKKADEYSSERGNSVLDLRAKKGDQIIIELNLPGIKLERNKKQFVWQNKFNKCSFFVEIPKDYRKNRILGEIFVSINGAITAEVDFYTQIVESYTNKGNAPISHRQIKKTFISYSHADEDSVKFIAKAYELQGIDHFFDRTYLKSGDIFPEKISDYIKNADLFVLCWSANAECSEYVKKELGQALSLAKNHDLDRNSNLIIRPISIKPYADYPSSMKNEYHFEVIS